MKSTGKKRGTGMGEKPEGAMAPETSSQEMPSSGMETETAGSGMPAAGMEEQPSGGGMPGGMMGSDRQGGPVGVLVELRIPAAEATSFGLEKASAFDVSGFQLDPGYQPVPMGSSPDASEKVSTAGGAGEPASEQTVIVRGTIPEEEIPRLEAREEVVKVWRDTRIAPFGLLLQEERETIVEPMVGFGTCPIGTCDCSSGTAKGTIAEVATYLGVDQIWASGFKGETIVVGVVDGGITAAGRPIKSADTSNPGWPAKLIPRVIGGWPTADWGTTGVTWGWHGNMCSTDVLGMAPNAQIYDIRIAASAISDALAGFQWAIDQHKTNGTPQILTNSWGIFQKSWDADYATNPNHPFTRKVIDALNEGILVLFAAGNCGGTCPDGRCGSDTGPGKSIWGANSHPRVITVGAVNKNEQFVGYSSQGPGALDPQKPDFCSITHFKGFFPSDSGTSAATPIAAGVVALLKQANPGLTQDQVKANLKSTAKDIGPAGWDQHSGSGILRAKAAFDASAPAPRASGPVVAWGSDRLDVFVLGTDRALYHKWYGGGWGPSFTGYENMGGVCTSTPEVVSWGPNRLDVFVTGTDSALYHKWYAGGWGPSLTGYEYMGGTILGNPEVVSWGPDRLDVFVLGTDRALYHKWYAGGWGPSLTGYEAMGGTIVGDPKAVAWGPDRLDVFVLGTDRAVYHKWWNGSAWGPSLTGYEAMGGTCASSPEVVSWGSNRLDVFVLGTDQAVYHKWWNGSAWGPSLTGYENMGGVCASPPTAVSWGPNRLDLFVIGTDSALYHKWWNGSSWGPSLTGWEYMGGVCSSPPRVVAWGPNRLDVFVTGMDSQLYHKWWNGSAWGPSLTGYEAMGGKIVDF